MSGRRSIGQGPFISLFKSAVGLAYDAGTDEAPRIAVKGSLMNADEIVRLARRFGIPVVEQAGLSRSLSTLELDAQIPPSLFEAAAILIAHLRKAA